MTTKPELKELGDFLNPVLGIPVDGKAYRVQAMSAQNALLVETVMGKAMEAGTVDPNELALETDDDAETFFQRILGDTYQELLDGGISRPALQHIIAIVIAWTFSGFDLAQEYFTSGGKVRPKPTDHKPKTGTQTRTGAGTTTRNRGSATTTSTRKATTGKAPTVEKS